MSEVITIGVGGTGINLAKSAMIQNAREHSIGYDGLIADELANRPPSQDINNHVLFRQSQMGTWTPRSILIDNEPDHIDALLSEPVGELVEPDQYCYGQEAAKYH